MSDRRTVILADDHRIVRDGLRYLLAAQGNIQVVGDAATGREAVELARQLRPDVVIMDITMPELNGIDATEVIRTDCSDTQVIILSMHATSEHIFRALRAGALGYLLKESAGSEVVEAIDAVCAGRRYLSQRIADTVFSEYLQLHDVASVQSPLDSLTKREREILHLVVEGNSSAEIGVILALSAKTVDTYRSRMMRKLGISDLPGLVKFAIEHGIISLN
jgi:DNA-binding NarL/FixJ family response regulator